MRARAPLTPGPCPTYVAEGEFGSARVAPNKTEITS